MKALIKKSTGKPEVLWTGYAINQDFNDAVEKDYAGECKRAYFTGMWAWGANGSEDRGLGTANHPTAKDIVNAFKMKASSVEICDRLDDNTPVEYMLVDLQNTASSPVCKQSDIVEGFELIDGSISACDFSEKTVNLTLTLDDHREASYRLWSEMLFPVMEAVGADHWADMGRVRIRAVARDGFVLGIGHATEDKFLVSDSIMKKA
jgi:hypothetical protein